MVLQNFHPSYCMTSSFTSEVHCHSLCLLSFTLSTPHVQNYSPTQGYKDMLRWLLLNVGPFTQPPLIHLHLLLPPPPTIPTAMASNNLYHLQIKMVM